MRIPDREVLFTGQHRCPEFDQPQELPERLKILLCFLDGAERRQQLQAKINAVAASELSGPRARRTQSVPEKQ
jgi:hypothetical protein